jgi:hypothetical protein
LATSVTDLTRSAPARLAAPVGLAAAAGLGALALRLRDPHESGSWGYCPYHLLTGGWCPGCGGLRAVNDLTHGDLVGAASSNLLFVAMLPFIAAFWVLWVRAAWFRAAWFRAAADGRPPPRLPSSPLLIVPVVTVAVAFTVLRNLSVGAWLAP